METLFGKNVKALREDRRWTQGDLANKVGVASHSTVSKWETDGVIPPAPIITSLAALFDITIDELLSKDMTRRLFFRDLADKFSQEETVQYAPRPLVLRDVFTDEDAAHESIKPIQSYVLTDQEVRLIAYYRIMSREAQSAILTMAKASAGGGNESDETTER